MINLPDIQESTPTIDIPISIVGVQDIKLPFKLKMRNGNFKDMVANTYIATNLRHDKKGISMSRLLLSIKQYLNDGLNWEIIKKCLCDISEAIEEKNSYIKFEFDLAKDKQSPLSDFNFPLFHRCSFEGHRENNKYKFYQTVIVQYSSYCPCSAALSKDLIDRGFQQGFPHAQRSFAKVIVSMDLCNRKVLYLEDIIDTIYDCIKTQPYPIIKRVDEQEISRIASENPLFVEDAIRLLSVNIDNLNGIDDWIIKCEHEESIHTHNAIAINWKGKEGGFTQHDI